MTQTPTSRPRSLTTLVLTLLLTLGAGTAGTVGMVGLAGTATAATAASPSPAGPQGGATGTIRGTVTSESGTPLGQVGILVWAYVSKLGYWDLAQESTTTSAGTYSVTVPVGGYRISFEPDPMGPTKQYLPESWDDVADVEDARTFSVGTGAVVVRDAALARAATLDGRFTLDGAAPRLGLVSLYTLTEVVDGEDDTVGSLSWELVDDTMTDATGAYHFDAVDPGRYKVGFSAPDRPDVYWTGAGSAPTTDLDAAGVLTVVRRQVVAGIDAAVVTPGTITGTVTFPAGATAADAGLVRAVDAATGAVAATTRAAADGAYTLTVAPGRYRVEFNHEATQTTAVAQTYPGVDDGGSGTPTPVTVTAGRATAGIDATLRTGARLVGRLLSPGGTPVAGCPVEAYASDGSLVSRTTRTAADGTFALTGLGTGRYAVAANRAGVDDRATGGLCAGAPAAWDATTNGGLGGLGGLLGQVVSGTSGFVVGTLGAVLRLPQALTYGVDPAAYARTAPTVAGTPRVGAPLVARPGSWGISGPAAGTAAPVDLAYQWYAGGRAVAGATAARFVPTAAQRGRRLTVVVTATPTGTPAGGGTALTGTATSAATRGVAAGTLRPRTAPVLRGTARTGRTLAVTPGRWDVAGVRTTVTWLRDGRVVRGATGTRYALTGRDRGHRLVARVVATKPGYAARTVTTRATAVVR